MYHRIIKTGDNKMIIRIKLHDASDYLSMAINAIAKFRGVIARHHEV